MHIIDPQKSEHIPVFLRYRYHEKRFLKVCSQGNRVGPESKKNIKNSLFKLWPCMQALVKGTTCRSCRGIIHHPDLRGFHRLQLSRIFRDSHGIDCFVTGHGRPYHMPIVCHGSGCCPDYYNNNWSCTMNQSCNYGG